MSAPSPAPAPAATHRGDRLFAAVEISSLGVWLLTYAAVVFQALVLGLGIGWVLLIAVVIAPFALFLGFVVPAAALGGDDPDRWTYFGFAKRMLLAVPLASAVQFLVLAILLAARYLTGGPS